MSVRRSVLANLYLAIAAISGLCAAAVVCASSRGEAASVPAARTTTTASPADPTPEKNLEVELGSPDFAERETASKQAFERQRQAIPALLAAALRGNLEAAVRAVGVLESIYVSADARQDESIDAVVFAPDDAGGFEGVVEFHEAGLTIDGAEAALDELARSARPQVADRADVALDDNYPIRERRALAEIARLHGKAEFVPIPAPRSFWNPGLNPGLRLEPPVDGSRQHAELRHVIVGPKWLGGDKGLDIVARLKRLKMLYRIQGAPVSDAAISRLRAKLPQLEVQVRGSAKLGIECPAVLGTGEKGCLIRDVKEGEAASNAGLQRGDLIVDFDHKPIENFDSLIEMLRDYKAGDTVPVTIIRAELPKAIPVTLTGWD